jgi:biopolymer transport protein ExbD
MQAPMTPLIDIVFMLLIYFLLTTNFISESGIDVNLPESSSAAARESQEITVYLDRDDKIYLGEEPVALNNLQQRLEDRLRAESGSSLVMVKADRSVDLESAVNVMDIARAAGAGRLFLATEKAGNRP